MPYLPLYNTHFFGQNEHVKLGVRIIHGVLYLVKQRKIWSEIWGCALYMGAYYTRANSVIRKLHDKITTDYTMLMVLCKKHQDKYGFDTWSFCLTGGAWKILLVDE